MKKIQQRVLDFMSRYAMDSGRIDILENTQDFIKEMRRGLCGEDCSLQMIPTYFSPADGIKTNEPVLVIDAGGTNCRAATVWFDENHTAHIDDRQSIKMPGVEKEKTYKEMFHEIALLIRPYLSKSKIISFCFSYASIPTPERDGIIVEIGKQVKVKGAEGKKVAQCLNEALREIGCEEKRMVVLNDSVSTLLGGTLSAKGKSYSGYIGFILGTGLNSSYVECTDTITKLNGHPAVKQMIIDTESGYYNKICRGSLDEAYDSTLQDTGTWQFEKMAAGRYQGGLTYTVVQKAIDDGLFSAKFSQAFGRVKDLESRQIDEFLDDPGGCNVLADCCTGPDSSDAITLYYIINELIERAAKLSAINLAALMMQAGIGENPFRPVCITGDGSTFYKSKMFRKKLDYYIKQCINDQMGLYCVFNRVEDGNMIGSALAALSVSCF